MCVQICIVDNELYMLDSIQVSFCHGYQSAMIVLFEFTWTFSVNPYIIVFICLSWKVILLGKNVSVTNKKVWRLKFCCHARTDVKDINCRSEPRTVALRLLCGIQPKDSLSFCFQLWQSSFYLFPSVATECQDSIPVSFSSHLQSRDVIVGSMAWQIGKQDGWNYCGKHCGDEVIVWPTLKVKQAHALTQQLHSSQHVQNT